MIDLDGLCRLLAKGRFDLASEAVTQADIEAYLRGALPNCVVEREFRLGAADRPDFLIDGGLIVEVKVKGSARRSTTRQILRYAGHERVRGIVLATNVAMPSPRPLIGERAVPFRVVQLGRAWL